MIQALGVDEKQRCLQPGLAGSSPGNKRAYKIVPIRAVLHTYWAA